MKTTFLILLFSTIPLLIHATDKQEAGRQSNGSNFVYVDVHIDQPNVEDCYETLVPDPIYDSSWFQVYPNPNQGIFNIEMDNLNKGEMVSIEIYDMTGKKVHNVSLQATGKYVTHELDLAAIPQGVYFISAQVNQHHNVKRLIIY